MLPEIKGKVMNVALETLGEEGLYIAADSQTEEGATTNTKWPCVAKHNNILVGYSCLQWTLTRLER